MIFSFIMSKNWVWQWLKKKFEYDHEFTHSIVQVRGALETLVGALTPIEHTKGSKNEVQPALMNTDLLSREADSISLLLSLLVRSLYLHFGSSWMCG